MADERMPEEMISWMNSKGWGKHHDQWHFERRWDFWHAIAAQPQHPSWVNELIGDAVANGWTRSPIQEGESGNGEDFLFMHRAMFQLLVDNFPQHLHFLRGWNSPPQEPSDPAEQHHAAKRILLKTKHPKMKWLVLALVAVGVIAGGVKHFQNGVTEYYSTYWHSTSRDEAVENGTFVGEVKIVPATFRWHGQEATVQEAWVERASQIKYRFLFFRSRHFLDGYELIVRVDNPSLFSGSGAPILVIGDEGKGVGISGGGEKGEVLNTNLSSLDQKEYRASLIGRWKDVRKKDIIITLP